MTKYVVIFIREYPCCVTHRTATGVCMYFLFICFAMTTGVLVVCLSVPKPIGELFWFLGYQLSCQSVDFDKKMLMKIA